MTAPARTRLVLVVLIVVLLGWEAYAVMNGQSGDTISEVVWTESARHLLLPFLAGLLCGHFFWQRRSASQT